MRATGYDTYWKTGKHRGWDAATGARLAAAGYHHSVSVGSCVLSKWIHRVESNLLCYDQCTESELEKFAKDRNLKKQDFNGVKYKHSTLIKRLEAADAAFTFPRFPELAAELRIKIYEHYMASFPSYLTKPVQPPITRVSQQLRKEALPIFYNVCSFNIKLIHRSQHGRYSLGFHEDTYTWIESLTEANVGDIKKFQVIVKVVPEAILGDKQSFNLQVVLHKSSADVLLYEAGALTYVDRARITAAGDAFEAVITGIADHEDAKKLKAGDFYAMRRALEERLYPKK